MSRQALEVALITHLATLQDLKEQLQQIPSQTSPSTDQDCAICYSLLTTEDSVLISCGHMFHHHCITNWGSNCPFCRMHFTPTSLLRVRNGIPDANQHTLPLSPTSSAYFADKLTTLSQTFENTINSGDLSHIVPDANHTSRAYTFSPKKLLITAFFITVFMFTIYLDFALARASFKFSFTRSRIPLRCDDIRCHASKHCLDQCYPNQRENARRHVDNVIQLLSTLLEASQHRDGKPIKNRIYNKVEKSREIVPWTRARSNPQTKKPKKKIGRKVPQLQSAVLESSQQRDGKLVETSIYNKMQKPWERINLQKKKPGKKVRRKEHRTASTDRRLIHIHTEAKRRLALQGVVDALTTGFNRLLTMVAWMIEMPVRGIMSVLIGAVNLILLVLRNVVCGLWFCVYVAGSVLSLIITKVVMFIKDLLTAGWNFLTMVPLAILTIVATVLNRLRMLCVWIATTVYTFLQLRMSVPAPLVVVIMLVLLARIGKGNGQQTRR